MTAVEQILNDTVVLDADIRIKPSEIAQLLTRDFGATGRGNPYQATINGQDYLILVKQVTYLGHPHDLFKKRIQIPKEWSGLLKQERTLLLGIYRYRETVMYVFFDTAQYRMRAVNNSSAHVHTIDLQKGQEYGVFTKTDMGGNVITVVAQSHIRTYLSQLNSSVQSHNKELNLLDDFKAALVKKWQGIDCYQEMIQANYKNKFQPEWAGFYLEFQFEKFLNADSKRQSICQKLSNKKSGEIDLDLHFHPKQPHQFFADLKAHSSSSPDILGNDWGAIDKALTLYRKIWYIVVSHDTEKDSAHEYVTTKFWNHAQSKTNELSYANKMKFSVELTHLKILEINAYNYQHLSEFAQGKNNDGKPRNTKIKIAKKSINNFLIYQSTF